MSVSVAIAPAMPDLAHLAAELRVPVLAQHVDPLDAGPGPDSCPRKR